MKFANATNFNRKSGEAEGSAVRLTSNQNALLLIKHCNFSRNLPQASRLLGMTKVTG
jgi:hypothetical protein